MDRGAWWAAVHEVARSQTRLSDFTFAFHLHALDKEMATHSSVLAWRIPGTGGAWYVAVYGVTQSQTRLKRLSSSSSNKSPLIHISRAKTNPMANSGEWGECGSTLSQKGQNRKRQQRQQRNLINQLPLSVLGM